MNEIDQSGEIEASFLGAVLAKPALIDGAARIVHAKHFSIEVHADIWRCCTDLHAENRSVTPLSVARFFESRPVFGEGITASQYLFDLVGNTISTVESQVLDYARIIRDGYMRRQAQLLGSNLQRQALSGNWNVDFSEVIAKAESDLADLLPDENDHTVKLEVALERAHAVAAAASARRAQGLLAGLATGLTALDKLTGGLHPGDFTVIGARPSMGKTTLAKTIAINAARTDVIVLLFSLEMSVDQLGLSFLSTFGGIAMDDLRKGNLQDGELDLLRAEVADNAHLPIVIDDTPAQSLDYIRSTARRVARGRKLGLIVIDYLQLIGDDSTESRVQQLARITGALKKLAKALGVPVIALSQLSRQVEYRDDKRPTLADLRESGAIEQDADNVAFLYREDYYLRRERPKRERGDRDADYDEKLHNWRQQIREAEGKAEIILAKQRMGPTGTAVVGFHARYGQFVDLPDENMEGGVPWP